MSMVSKDKKRTQRLLEASRRTELEFLESELQIADTFLDVAKTELRLGEVEAARAAREKAVVAANNVARQIRKAKLRGSDVENLERGLQELHAHLKAFPHIPIKRAA